MQELKECTYMYQYMYVHRWVQVLSAGGLTEKKHQPWWHRPIISQQTMIRSRKTRQGIKCVWWIKSGGDTSFEISARKTWRLRDSTLFENSGSCRCNHAEATGEDARRSSHFHKFFKCANLSTSLGTFFHLRHSVSLRDDVYKRWHGVETSTNKGLTNTCTNFKENIFIKVWTPTFIKCTSLLLCKFLKRKWATVSDRNFVLFVNAFERSLKSDNRRASIVAMEGQGSDGLAIAKNLFRYVTQVKQRKRFFSNEVRNGWIYNKKR